MILKGEKVVLRPVRMDDAPRFVKWFNDPSVHQFLSVREMSLKGEKEWIKARLKSKNIHDLHFCIDTIDGKHIGSIGLHQINKLDKHAVFGIMIGEKTYWDHGLGTEATKLMLGYAFKKLKLHKVKLGVHVNNPRAIKVYKRLGFVKEGVKRDEVLWKGKYYNSYIMSLLENEWKRRNNRNDKI
ncbi:MAG TPA: GNAT family protein [Candidatus Limnocylindria bacterium]|nr:GNAT family protein [Candidatus Limnocylindria bacterium]